MLRFLQQLLSSGSFDAIGVKTGSEQYSVMAYMGKESKKEWIYVYV